MFTIPFDGTAKPRCGISDYRVECGNTWNKFYKNINESEFIETKQTKGAQERINKWFSVLADMQKEKDSMAENFRAMASKVFGEEKQAQIISKLFDDKDTTRSNNQMLVIADILKSNRSNIP